MKGARGPWPPYELKSDEPGEPGGGGGGGGGSADLWWAGVPSYSS